MKILRLALEIIMGILQLVCLFVLGGICFLVLTGLRLMVKMLREKRLAVSCKVVG